jgi:hypothetical protein
MGDRENTSLARTRHPPRCVFEYPAQVSGRVALRSASTSQFKLFTRLNIVGNVRKFAHAATSRGPTYMFFSRAKLN